MELPSPPPPSPPSSSCCTSHMKNSWLRPGHAGSAPSVQVNQDLLSKEMASLTFQERELLYHEIHGVFDVIEETPEFIETSLQKMREELERIPKHRRKALDRALFLRPSLATDDDFHLIFLRAERFDPKTAAHKFYRHFEHKLELWGDKRLVKRITLDDLGEEEMKLVRAGSIRTPVVNHRGVKAFILLAAAHDDMRDWRAVTRYCWYQNMALLEDENVQKQGAVAIVSLHGKMKFPVGQLFEWFAKGDHILKDWPIRYFQAHIGYDSPTLHTFLSILGSIQTKAIRLRSRNHCGSALEVQYALMTYGIRLSPDCFEEEEDDARRQRIGAFLKERQEIEAEFARQEALDHDGSADKLLLYPSAGDVTMGRGRGFTSWVGNCRMAANVEARLHDYTTATTRTEKTAIAYDIVQKIQQSGGRFIDRTNTGWVIVEDGKARKKVSQMLRADARRDGQKDDPDCSMSDEEQSNPKRPRINYY